MRREQENKCENVEINESKKGLNCFNPILFIYEVVLYFPFKQIFVKAIIPTTIEISQPAKTLKSK